MTSMVIPGSGVVVGHEIVEVEVGCHLVEAKLFEVLEAWRGEHNVRVMGNWGSTSWTGNCEEEVPVWNFMGVVIEGSASLLEKQHKVTCLFVVYRRLVYYRLSESEC